MVSRKLASIRAVLRKAREVKDPLAEFADGVRPCSSNSQLVQVRSYHARDMPKELMEWCLDVCRENMAALYDRVWTWSDVKKRKQLTSAASRFLVAHDSSLGRAPLAYINYRFEEDEGYAVLYCYELQVVRTAQSRGLGRRLMDLAEQIAWGSGMSKLMLTVFCDNTTAVAFYRKLGYHLDETSPDYCPGSSGGGSGGGSGGSSGSGGGGSSSSGGSGSGGSGSCGLSCASSLHGGSGSGSQTDSAGAGGGYHIMSKGAPAGHLDQRQALPEGLMAPAAAQPQQQQQHGDVQERAKESDRRDASSQPESNKRPRTVAPDPQGGAVREAQAADAALGDCGVAAGSTLPPSSQPQSMSLRSVPEQPVRGCAAQDTGAQELGQEQRARQPPRCSVAEQEQEQQAEGSQEQQQTQQQEVPGFAERQAAEQQPPLQQQREQQQQQAGERRGQQEQEERPGKQLGMQRPEPPAVGPVGPQTAPAAVASPGLLEAEDDAAGTAGCVELFGRAFGLPHLMAPSAAPTARDDSMIAAGAEGRSGTSMAAGDMPMAEADVEAGAGAGAACAVG